MYAIYNRLNDKIEANDLKSLYDAIAWLMKFCSRYPDIAKCDIEVRDSSIVILSEKGEVEKRFTIIRDADC
jgi:hypothetical protein